MVFSQTESIQKLFFTEQATIDQLEPFLDFDKLSTSKQHQKMQASSTRVGVNRVNELRVLADLDAVAAYMLGKSKANEDK